MWICLSKVDALNSFIFVIFYKDTLISLFLEEFSIYQ